MTDWLTRAKAQLETHATALHGIEAIGTLIKQALVTPGSNTSAVLQVIEKITDALIAGFDGKVTPAEIRKQLDLVLKTEETVNEAADRKLAEKFGRIP